MKGNKRSEESEERGKELQGIWTRCEVNATNTKVKKVKRGGRVEGYMDKM